MATPKSSKTRLAQRFPYLEPGVALYQGQKYPIKIKALGQDGILFKCTHPIAAGEHVGLGWRDEQAGIIRGTFAILAQRQTPKKTTWYYYARFIKIDEEVQKAIVQIISRIRQSSSDRTRVTLAHIEQVVALGPAIFSTPRQQIESLEAVHLLDTISAEQLQFLTQPQSDEEEDLQALQTLSLQARMIYQYLDHAPTLPVEDMKQIIEQTRRCLKAIVALEKTEGFAKRADASDEEITENPKTEALHRYLIIASNQTYETISQIYTYFEQGEWLEAVKPYHSIREDLQIMQDGIAAIEKLFKEEFEISYDETSFGEAVLAKTIMEETNPKKPTPMAAWESPQTKGKSWGKTIFAFLLMGGLVFRLWMMFGDDGNIQKKLQSQLPLPIPTARIAENGQSLIIVFGPEQWTLADEATRKNAQEQVEQFLQTSRYISAFAYADDQKLVFARTKQSTQ
jgi:hypothetical protein